MVYDKAETSAFRDITALIASKETAESAPSSFTPEEEERVLELCERHPSVANKLYPCSKGVSLLNFLIGYSASLRTLETFFQLTDTTTTTDEATTATLHGLHLFPLHQACENTETKPGVTPFLVQKYPMAASERAPCSTFYDTSKKLPLHSLLLRPTNVPLQDVQALFQATDVSPKQQERLIQLAFAGGSGREVLQYVVDQCQDVRQLGIHRFGRDQRFTMEHAIGLSHLVRQVETFLLTLNQTLEAGAWQHLMTALGNSQSLKSMLLDLTRVQAVAEEEFYPETDNKNTHKSMALPLHKALVSMPNLNSLTLIGGRHMAWTHDDISNGGILTQALATLLRRNSISGLFVRKFRLDQKLFWDALANNKSLKRMDIASCVSDKGQRQHLHHLLETSNTSLQYVAMEGLVTPLDEKIRYLTQLNRSGRSQARRSPDKLVNGIIEASAQPVLLYGLLRDTPSIWCTAVGQV